MYAAGRAPPEILGQRAYAGVRGATSFNAKKVLGCVNSAGQPKGNATAQTGFWTIYVILLPPSCRPQFTSAKSEPNSLNFDIFEPFQQKMGNKGKLKE